MTWTIPKASAYGGVLINDAEEVLLREPANHFDGYVWTFAKGRPEKGDTPDQTALREVLEETGYRGEILGVLPGVYKGGTSTNAYFVMRPEGRQGSPDWETQSTQWVSFDVARQMIELTKNGVGRVRDLSVLAATLAWLKSECSNQRIELRF